MTLLTQSYNVASLFIGKVVPLKALISASETSFTVSFVIHLANPNTGTGHSKEV
ncbi:hypothetical protein SAMN02745132_02631 [Enterovibrio nigricans DSM 22720]|uniref:Uncharacterized protein n=1 Tax=Enterovibrio nigricans DSM 22720 TaxID=1121868 RepID=A0A1T4UVS6_9GAMM|nr:hypothetical protein SAMN02745132_02631 [Enterovibrio nigricans DSM 22720]